MKVPLNNILIAGDAAGIPELLDRVPVQQVAAIVAASNRPQYHNQLKSIAKDIGVNIIIQPMVEDRMKYDEFISNLEQIDPDGLLSHSYSMLIRSDVLHLVEGRAFNIHASLLPRNRGPNPVQWALIRGENKTGVTLHVMNEGVDAGNIIDQEEIEILHSDTWVALIKRVMTATRKLMDRGIPKIIEGTWKGFSQNVANVTVNHRITPDSFKIDFSVMTDAEIFNLIRAQVSPLSGVYLDGQEGRRRFPDYLTVEQVSLLRKELGKNV